MRRSTRLRRMLDLALALVLVLPGAPARAASPFDPPNPLELRVLGQDRWLAKCRFALRILVRDALRDQPLEADVTITLARSGDRGRGEWRRLWEGRTGPLGTADLSLRAPDLAPGSYVLAVEVTSPLGRDRIERPLTLTAGIDVALVTDHPRYLPGDVVHIRGLVLQRPSLRPAGEVDIPIEIEDTRGNRIYQQTHRTSRFGWFDLDYPLAREILAGTYRIRARLPDGPVECTFVAAPETTPPSGPEDAPPEGSTQEPLAIRAVVEGGRLGALLENTVFVLLSHRDGRPVPWAHVRATTGGTGGTTTEHTADALGIVELHLVPPSVPLALAIQARDDDGHDTTARLELPGRPKGDALVLTLDRALARPGDKVRASIASTRATGPVYLDLVAHGQTVLVKAAALERGRAEVTISLPADATGAIEMRAYHVTGVGRVVGDARRLVVDPTVVAGTRVEVSADRPIDTPGDRARLTFTVRDGRRSAVDAELAVSVLTGGGFAPADTGPGEEEAHFALAPEPALLAPAAAVHGWSATDLVLNRPVPLPGPPTPLALAAGRERAARVLLAVAPSTIDFPLRADSYDERLAVAKTRWLAAIARDATAIQAAIAQYHRPGASKRTPLAEKDALVRLVNLKLLVARAAQDPWGNRYHAGLDGRRLSGLLSSGPDAEFGSRDDVAFGDPGAGTVPRPVQVEAATTSAPDTAIGADTTAGTVAPPPGETLVWQSLALSGETGEATLEVTAGDAGTTRQVTGVAAGPDGLLGAVVLPLPGAPEILAGAALPPALTRGDEVQVEVKLRGQAMAETVHLALETEPGLKLLDSRPRRDLALQPGEERVESFRVAATGIGRAEVAIAARTDRGSHEVRCATLIHADGKPVVEAVDGRLSGATTLTLRLPGAALDRTRSVLVRFLPGPVAAATTALDAVLGWPTGSFDTAWAAARVSAILADAHQRWLPDPELAARAHAATAIAYQRLLTYQTASGGFSRFGEEPADPLLTARALLALQDLSRIQKIDPRVARRARTWLTTAAWGGAGADLAVTAEIAWALAESGWSEPVVRQALDSIAAAVEASPDPRALALATGALAAGGGPAAVVDRAASALGAIIASGESGTDRLETAALAALALWRTGRDGGAARQATDALELARDPEGAWRTGPATIAALEALRARSIEGPTEDIATTVTVLVNGSEVEHFALDRETADSVRSFHLGPRLRSGANRIELRSDGSGSVPYQIVSRYHLPWPSPTQATPSDPARSALTLAVDYDPPELVRDQIVSARAAVSNRSDHTTGVVVLEVGLPPGFAPERAPLDALLASRAIRRFEVGARSILVHLDGIEPGASRTVEVKLRSGAAGRVRTPPSRAYELADPVGQVDVPPVVLRVRD